MPSSYRSFLKSGTQLSINQAIVQACSFVRNVIVARLISPADFGIAATFVMTFSLLDMISNLSADTLLVQAKDGDEPLFQGTAHSIHLIRGLINAILLFAL